MALNLALIKEEAVKILAEIRQNQLSERSKIVLVYLATGIFIAANSFLIYKEFYWGIIIPAFIVIAWFFLFAFDKVLLLIIFLTPLSVNLIDPDLNVGISIPAEPLMFGVLVLFVFKVLFDLRYDRTILKHPVSIAIILNLIWLLFTTITSEIPLVSLKAFTARLWFVIPMFFVMLMIFKEKKNLHRVFWYYGIALAIVIFYTTTRHYLNGFAEKTGTWVMKPFYNDHTAYGSALAMFIPVFVAFIMYPRYNGGTRFLALIMVMLMATGLVLSFSRAAWISMAVGFIACLIMMFRIKFRWIVLAGIVLFGVLYAFRFQIIDYLAKNKQDSSAHFIEHVQSIANISSDASNLERINRWQSALRMFNERPVFGFGPGTYQFLYAPYQRSKEKTIISTNFGDVGNAHSEYFGPLAESGLLGMLTFLGILITSIATGLRVYRHSSDREIRILSLAIVVGLITYFTHGFLNNFLDTDKLSVPFWFFIACLVAMDVYYGKSPVQKNNDIISSVRTSDADSA